MIVYVSHYLSNSSKSICSVFASIMPITMLPISQQNIKLQTKDKLSIGDIAKIVSKSKYVVHGILKVYYDTGSCEAKKSPGRP